MKRKGPGLTIEFSPGGKTILTPENTEYLCCGPRSRVLVAAIPFLAVFALVLTVLVIQILEHEKVSAGFILLCLLLLGLGIPSLLNGIRTIRAGKAIREGKCFISIEQLQHKEVQSPANFTYYRLFFLLDSERELRLSVSKERYEDAEIGAKYYVFRQEERSLAVLPLSGYTLNGELRRLLVNPEAEEEPGTRAQSR